MISPSKQFLTEITKDGSPTLRIQSDMGLDSRAESMHHSGGAATETLYIYGGALDHVLKKTLNFNSMVVGLGLGYIEMLIAKKIDQHNVKNQKILSYEADPELRIQFKQWMERSDQIDKDSEMSSEIYNKVSESLGMTAEQSRKNLLQNNIIFEPALTGATTWKEKYHFIAFDAFSQKTSESLWTEEFLDYFLENACDENCVFTTYACTGVLKRALKKKGFQLIERPGFQSKRDSTLGVRGVFLLDT